MLRDVLAACKARYINGTARQVMTAVEDRDETGTV
jgi:hypothetical protein